MNMSAQERVVDCLLFDAAVMLDKAQRQLDGGYPGCAGVLVVRASILFSLALEACRGVAVASCITTAVRHVSLEISRLSTKALIATQRLEEKTKHS